MTESDQPSNVPFFSTARFGPGSIAILLLLATVCIVLFELGLTYLSLISLGGFSIILGVKSFEILHSSRPKEKEFVGRTCYVMTGLPIGGKGVVRIFNSDGSLEPELWSAESSHEIPEGSVVEITGMRSIVLLVEPI